MKLVVKLIIPVLAGLILLNGCNNSDETTSPYGEIHNLAPFSALSDSIKKQPKNDELYFRRAVLLNKNNFPEPALADFEKAWSLKKNERYAYAIGTLLTDKKPGSALTFLNDALKELPESFLLQLTLARSYDAMNNTDEALKICDGILQTNPEQVDVLILKSDLLAKKGNMNESVAVLEKAYSLTPFDLELNFNLADKYAENKNPKVIQLCDSLIRKDSLKIYAEPFYFKGLYYSNIKDRTTAIALFDDAIKRNFQFLNAYIEKSKVFYDQSKFEEAYKVANLAMSISPKFADAYYWMAKCQEATGNKEEARLNYQRAYGLDKTFTQAKEAAEKISN